MNQEVVNKISLFFFFAYLDEDRAIQSSSKAYHFFLKILEKSPNENIDKVIVSVTKKIWEEEKHKIKKGHSNVFSKANWILPEGIDFAPWREFQKSATDEELLPIIWGKILKISDADISHSLQVSPGSVRYRFGRALRKAGAMISLGNKNLKVLK